MEGPRGDSLKESSHTVTKLETAQEWLPEATESDLPMKISQWKTYDGRIHAIFSNSKGERIGERG